MPLVPINVQRVAEELRVVIQALEVVSGIRKVEWHESLSEWWDDPEVYLDGELQVGWINITSGIGHLKHLLNEGDIDSLDCDHRTRSTLDLLWWIIEITPLEKSTFYQEMSAYYGYLIAGGDKEVTPTKPLPFPLARRIVGFPIVASSILTRLTGEVYREPLSPSGKLLLPPIPLPADVTIGPGLELPERQDTVPAALAGQVEMDDEKPGPIQTGQQPQVSPAGMPSEWRKLTKFTPTEVRLVNELWGGEPRSFEELRRRVWEKSTIKDRSIARTAQRVSEKTLNYGYSITIREHRVQLERDGNPATNGRQTSDK
jgi:hypothetical protein